MHRSETITEIAGALAAFGAEATNPPQTRTAQVQTKAGGSYSYGYSDLADVLAHVRPALAAHGLTLTQEVICRPEKVGVKTSLFHSSGEFIDYRPLWLPAPAEATPQAYGSAITYARRYSLLAALNLASATDDDGAGSGRLRRVRQAEALGQDRDREADRQDPRDRQGGRHHRRAARRRRPPRLRPREPRRAFDGAGLGADRPPRPAPGPAARARRRGAARHGRRRLPRAPRSAEPGALRGDGMSAPRHGSHSTYKNHGCRCPACRAAAADYQRDLQGAPAQRGLADEAGRGGARAPAPPRRVGGLAGPGSAPQRGLAADPLGDRAGAQTPRARKHPRGDRRGAARHHAGGAAGARREGPPPDRGDGRGRRRPQPRSPRRSATRAGTASGSRGAPTCSGSPGSAS